MHFKTRRIIASVAVIGAVAAGGAAYTAGSGFGSIPTASYSGTSIGGAQATDLTFNYSNDGSHILKAQFVLTPKNGTDDYTDESTYEIQAGFGTDASMNGTPGATGLQASTLNDPANTTNGTTPAGNTYCVPSAGTAPATDVTCSFAAPGVPVAISTDGSTDVSPLTAADQFNVLVTTIQPTG
jgi:hypothetical protein